MFGVLLCLFSIGAEPALKFAPGDRAAILVDVNGDAVGEMLVVESSEPGVEMGSVFDLHIKLTNPRGNILFESDEIGELGWFSVEKTMFEYETGAQREVALIRTGCSGTGVHVNAILLYQPPKVKQVMVAYEGNEGLYDADGNGVVDMFISRWRHMELGVWGYTSPWPPTFSRPTRAKDWDVEDFTFYVLSRDREYREEWIDDLSQTYELLLAFEDDSMVGPDHLRYLTMLIDALKQNDTDEASRIYYTYF